MLSDITLPTGIEVQHPNCPGVRCAALFDVGDGDDDGRTRDEARTDMTAGGHGLAQCKRKANSRMRLVVPS
jgi:hypothetical protein